MKRPTRFYVCALCAVIAAPLWFRSYGGEEGVVVRNGRAYAGIATHRGGMYCYWFTDSGPMPPMIRGWIEVFSQPIIKDYGNQTVDQPDVNALGFTYQNHGGIWAGRIASVPF